MRYQSARDMLIDLKNLRRELDIQGELERSIIPNRETAGTSGENATQRLSGAGESKGSGQIAATQNVTTSSSSLEYAVAQAKSHKLVSAIAGLLLIGVIAAGVYFTFVLKGSSSGQINSIAVLPFVNESGNADIEYLSDGMTETLIGTLSQIPKLNIKARSSVFRYKGKDVSPQTVGNELSVQAVLLGRVNQRREMLTLSLELVDVRTQNVIWIETYNRPQGDLISLQGEIARDVSSKLKIKLSGADEQKLAKNYTTNVEAYQLYLKGRFHVFKLTPPEVRKSIAYFQEAIEIDPSYALAYAGLSDAYRSLVLVGEMNPTETMPKSKAAAIKAIEIDGDLAEAHTALGVSLFWYDWNWTGAEEQYKRALELDPNNSLAHLFYAHLLSNTGRHAEALAEVKRARELDPLSSFVGALEGQFLLHAGQTDMALERLRQSSELDPSFFFPRIFASSTYIVKGMYREAAEEALRAKELAPNQTASVALGAYALAKLGKRDEARALLDELLKLSKDRFVPPYHIALVYNGLGEQDETLRWLERGIEQRDPKMAFLKVEPKWNNLRNQPQFKELLKKVGFPE